MEIQLTKPPESKEDLNFLGSIKVSPYVFQADFNGPLIHQAVTTYLANSHPQQKAQKSRAFVKGSHKKPWRQKGTGRARAGSVTSPLWRGGGVTFAAQPKLTSKKKLNRKMYRGALRSILSELVRLKRLLVIEHFVLETPKTQTLKKVLDTLNLSNVLIVLEGNFEVQNNEHSAIFRAARNLPRVSVLETSKVDPVSLIQFPYVVMTVAALKQLEEQLNDESKSAFTNN